MIFAIDFDGTLCEDKYPEIGAPKQAIIDKCKELKREGNHLILNTCRVGSKLKEALKWCSDQGLEFDTVNENLVERVLSYENDCRKIGADFYIDDKNLSLEEFKNFTSLKRKSVCPICGGEMDETYMGTHYCKKCEEYLLGDDNI
jgi:hypothetical protein